MTHTLVAWATFVGAGLVLYFWAIRPLILKTSPMQSLVALEGSVFSALKTKFAGIKTLILARGSLVIAAYVALHDQIQQAIGQSGVDLTPLTSHIPSWVWPIILVVDFWLIMKAREMTDRRKEKGE